MSCRLPRVICVAAIFGLSAVSARAEDVETLTIDGFLEPMLAEYCLDCHDAETQKGEFDIEKFLPEQALYKNRKAWTKVIDMLYTREMPPDKKPQPSDEVRDQLIEFLESKLADFDCSGDVNPGRVTIRRLNRIEYNNTIRDLMGVDFEPAADFPADEVGYGFDNIGDVLSLSPIQMEKYLDAAEAITHAAILSDYPEWPPRDRIEAEKFKSETEQVRPSPNGRYMGFYQNYGATREIEIPADGQFKLTIRAFGEQAGKEFPKVDVSIDGSSISVFEVGAREGEAADYTVEVPLKRGKHAIALAYLNNYFEDDAADRSLNGDRNVFVDYLEIVGPLDAPMPGIPESHAQFIPREPAPGQESALATETLGAFMKRAYRRPVSDDEVAKVAGFVRLVLDDGGSFEEAMQVAVQSILTNPNFLFRWEFDPLSGDASSRTLGDYELASRLSYFLWNSMPDAELFDLAEQGRLSHPEVLQEQVVRLVRDERSADMLNNFVGQWLQIRNLDRVTPDPELFPTFDEELKSAMRTETEMFFESLVQEDRSVLELISSDFTYLNERLARHYGVEGVEGDGFRKVSLDRESPLGGVLTQASVLTITSNPTRTSPVIRGKYILEQILGTPPPPPPPNVPELEEAGEGIQLSTLRQKLELHRDKPECATCHEKMDPLGFAFENFDAIGQWRGADGKSPIDPSGALPTGESFNGPRELKSILRERDGFVRSLVEKMLTFAIGRGLEYYDKCAVDEIMMKLAANDHRFSALISGIVESEPFRKRQTLVNNL